MVFSKLREKCGTRKSLTDGDSFALDGTCRKDLSDAQSPESLAEGNVATSMIM
jgi:hypothetical protein